jgi:hypothetical protein
MEYDLCLEPDLLELEGIEQEIILEPMTFEEKLVYFNLFDQFKDLPKFGEENLPPRVYQVWDWVQHNSKLENGYFFVCDSKTVHDPILVWKKDDYKYSTTCFTDSNTYLIARWGRALLPFKQLREKACRRLTMSLKSYADKECRRFNQYRKETDYHIEYLLEYGKLDGISISSIM